MGEIIGYARVSSIGQKLDVQLEKLEKYGCTKIYSEKRSGLKSERPELKACLEYVREGDKLVICKLDRLARSTINLFQIHEMLVDKKVDLVVLDQNLDTSTPSGKLLFGMLALIAEFETALRKERQLEGIQKAKDSGKQFGPSHKLNDWDRERLYADKYDHGMTVSAIQKKWRISRPQVYKEIRRHEERMLKEGNSTPQTETNDKSQ